MPPGADGFYYFSVYLLVDNSEYGRSDITINGETLCSTEGDEQESDDDNGQAACGAATYASVGW